MVSRFEGDNGICLLRMRLSSGVVCCCFNLHGRSLLTLGRQARGEEPESLHLQGQSFNCAFDCWFPVGPFVVLRTSSVLQG